jgi:hypothetical protein
MEQMVHSLLVIMGEISELEEARHEKTDTDQEEMKAC